MRRLAYLFAGGALWLFVAAIPASADGGPHVKTNTNGTGGLAADCAGCHRTHSAKTSTLLITESVTALCVVCHGSAGTGAATNVADGVQYTLATRVGTTGTPVLGALRGGGFVNARIGASTPTRQRFGTGNHDFLSKVPALDGPGVAVTSKHMSLTSSTGSTAWGNGDWGSGPGPTVTLDCTSCHNPHGNNQYRILIPQPNPTGTGFVAVAAPGVLITDAALPPSTDARNYTIIQTKGGTGTLLATQVAGVVNSGPVYLAGDYFRRKVPWNPSNPADSSTYALDAPNGDAVNFTAQMTAWCATCHTRYKSASRTEVHPADTIYDHRHSTTSSKPCIVCHVAHGSNAQMKPDPNTGTTYSQNLKDPGGTVRVNDSRLLKVDNYGTCQLCHDPTGTAPVRPDPGSWVGPSPDPLNP